MTEGCQEYKFKRRTTRSFHGKFGTYLTGGFHVDFDHKIADNTKKLKQLAHQEWIDQETRAVQMFWTVYSVWSKTFFTF